MANMSEIFVANMGQILVANMRKIFVANIGQILVANMRQIWGKYLVLEAAAHIGRGA